MKANKLSIFLLLNFLFLGICSNCFCMKRKRSDFNSEQKEPKRRKINPQEYVDYLSMELKNFQDGNRWKVKTDQDFGKSMEELSIDKNLEQYFQETKMGNFTNVRKITLDIIQILEGYLFSLEKDIKSPDQQEQLIDRFLWMNFSFKRILERYLFYAFYNGHKADIQELCSKMEKINDMLHKHEFTSHIVYQYAGFGTPLHWAASLGDFSVAKFLVEQLSFDINVVDHTNRTPMYVIFERSDVSDATQFDLIKYFIQKGADLNIQESHNNNTVLHLLLPDIFFPGVGPIKKRDILRFLILHGGADIYIRNKAGESPLDMAYFREIEISSYAKLYEIKEQVSLGKYDYKNHYGYSIFHKLINELAFSVAKNFEWLYGEIQEVGGYKEENEEKINKLIEYVYEDIDYVFKYSENILQELFRKAGDKLEKPDLDGLFPIHFLISGLTQTISREFESVWAIELKKMLVARIKSFIDLFLEQEDITVEQECKLKKTLLHYASFGYDEVERDDQKRVFYDGLTRYLIEKHQADVNKKDIFGYTPLHYATIWAKLSAIEALIENGADIEVKNNDQESPYDLSKKVRKSKEGKIAEYFDNIKSINEKFKMLKLQDRERKSKKKSLFSDTHKNYKLENCIICLENFSLDRKRTFLYPCGHSFHEDCLKKHVIMKGELICALCQQKNDQIELE